MRTLKLTIAYDGTSYSGWQSQPGGRTIQDVLEGVLARITREQIRTTASGRTDAGVHALGQVVSLETSSHLPPDVLVRALNAELPHDIAVLGVEEAAADFHAIRSAKRKRYRYVIHDGPVRDVFQRAYCWHYRERLDAERMHHAAQAWLGEHDFRSFESHWPQRQSSVRTVLDIQVRRGQGSQSDFIHCEFEADGFLYNMVRAMVGTLVEIGRGAQSLHWAAEVLAAQSRSAAGATAPPQGLMLLWVKYE